LSAKLEPTFADRGRRVVSVTDLHGHILGFLTGTSTSSFKQFLIYTHEAEWTLFQTHYFSKKSGSAENRTRTSESVAGNSDHLTKEALADCVWDHETKNVAKVQQKGCRSIIQFNSIQFIYVQNLTATGQLQS
jgi:hypothetical protein